jgi:hypothetical protein
VGEDGAVKIHSLRFVLREGLDGKVTQEHNANIPGTMNVTVVFADSDCGHVIIHSSEKQHFGYTPVLAKLA